MGEPRVTRMEAEAQTQRHQGHQHHPEGRSHCQTLQESYHLLGPHQGFPRRKEGRADLALERKEGQGLRHPRLRNRKNPRSPRNTAEMTTSQMMIWTRRREKRRNVLSQDHVHQHLMKKPRQSQKKATKRSRLWKNLKQVIILVQQPYPQPMKRLKKLKP